MLADRDRVAIVRAVLSLAQALGMPTTAEGIETNELAHDPGALGCTPARAIISLCPGRRSGNRLLQLPTAAKG